MSDLNLDNEQTKEIAINKPNDSKKDKVIDKQNLDDKSVKKLINKKIVIGIICILAIIVCIIVYVVLNKNKKEENGLVDESNLVSQVKDTYEGLNYNLKKEIIKQVGFFYDYSEDVEGNKIDVSYLKVEGFKDKKLQENVNELLKTKADELYDENDVQDEEILYSHIYNYTDVYIFNNVLSTLYCKETCYTDGETEYKYDGININLNNFQDIDFKDIFVNTTNLDEIMTQNMKDSYASEDFEFSISPKNVYINTKEGNVERINLYENKDKVAIFNRFATNKKLFEKTYNATPYVFTTKRFAETDLYGLVEDNLFIDTFNTLVSDGEEYSEGVMEAVEKLYTEATNKVRNISYSNPSKRYIVQIIPSIEKASEQLYNISVEYNLYQIDKEFFNSNVVNFVVESENKEEDEYEKVDYFESPVMNGDDYLKDSTSDILKKQVDQKGEDIQNNNTNTTQPYVNENTGIS